MRRGARAADGLAKSIATCNPLGGAVGLTGRSVVAPGLLLECSVMSGLARHRWGIEYCTTTLLYNGRGARRD